MSSFAGVKDLSRAFRACVSNSVKTEWFVGTILFSFKTFSRWVEDMRAADGEIDRSLCKLAVSANETAAFCAALSQIGLARVSVVDEFMTPHPKSPASADVQSMKSRSEEFESFTSFRGVDQKRCELSDAHRVDA